mmetsp:Transcript_677/g.1901  ORF Transcript_677/g.1901 Transcript_677/m.1901 type:complete len:94 (+) Transcript_677:1382-1663(+)
MKASHHSTNREEYRHLALSLSLWEHSLIGSDVRMQMAGSSKTSVLLSDPSTSTAENGPSHTGLQYLPYPSRHDCAVHWVASFAPPSTSALTSW